MLKTKRVYEPADKADGFRVLVDRLWPRGVSKERAQLGLWLKEAAPSNELRQWYGHDPEKWPEFKRRYRQELAGKPGVLEAIRAQSRKGVVTLVYGSKEERINNAVALKELLDNEKKESAKP